MFRRCGVFSLLMVAGFATAAPVPKSVKRSPAVTITLTPDDRDHRPGEGVCVTVTNHSADDLRWTYTTVPLAAFEVRVTDDTGQELDVAHPSARHSPFARAMPCRVAAGESLNMRFGVDQCFPQAGRPPGPLKVTVTFEHGGRTYTSEPLEVK